MSHIQIKNLKKSYVDKRRVARSGKPDAASQEIVVLDDINLEFEEGEMVCILGPSGCGKSTMLRMIAGFDQPTSGEVLINGEPIDGPRADNIFVFQHSGLLPWMTVWENVELGLRHLEDKEEKDKTIQEYITMVELTGFEHHYPHQLSGGMQRRAELARAIAVNPDTLIMDEPFSGLDFLTHMKVREEVVNMHEYIKKTTLIVTHDIDDALIMGDRVIVMSGRPSHVKLEKKLNFGRPRDLARNHELSELREEIFFMLGISYAV
ncbi:MAG: ATP-binding cassette domain-containing protein [Methylococcaceae bacterium]|nr:ATP-binding cassette domain-containing protein [Methylococcaceae bacterium]